uniref:Terpene synthase 9 n=1 Tax=Stevia rebaudiana TaxID=55670 RepID=A0A8F9S2D3_STERE|nr:terpene synthase 9 [Stevia rebaudiana]
MTSQGYLSSLFSDKVLYPRQLMKLSSFKSSKICMTSFIPSVRPSANTNITTTNELKDLMSPLSINDTMSFSQASNSLFVDHHEMKVILPRVDQFNNRIDELKEYTRKALIMSSNPTVTLNLIDTIQRLGVGYYFKEEIKNILEEIKQVLPEDDLYTVALHFRLRRHSGLHTNSGDVFQNFMDVNGELKKSSCEDIEGLLSLYEASYLGSSEEDVLSHAMEVTTRHLSKSVSELSPKLHEKVVDGLKHPRHMRMERLEARRFIEEYGNVDDHNPILLEFAKYDYNMVQSVLQRELIEINRWWEHLGLSSKLGFIRDRHVECFLWSVGLLPEVGYSSSRVELAKVVAILLVIDDVYDTYGSYDDLVLFTEAIQRWDLNEMEQLPEYMKLCFTALYNTNNEICDKVLKEQGLNAHSFLRKTWIDMAKAYMVETEWVKRGTIPTFKEYIENGVTTSGTYMALVHLFFLVLDGVTSDNSRLLLDSYPKFFTSAGTILRLWDDLGTVKEEQERGDMLSSIHVLMKEKNITSEEEGRKEVLQLIYGLWKDLNVELVTPDVMLLPMINVALNMSKASQVVYQHDDNSYLSSVENHVECLFYKPIDI